MHKTSNSDPYNKKHSPNFPGSLRYVTPNHRYARRPVYLPKLRKVCHISENVTVVYMTCF